MHAQSTEQKKAIQKLMNARRAAWRDDSLRASDFPKFTPGMTTADYLNMYQLGRAPYMLPIDVHLYATPAPMLDAAIPEVCEVTE